MPTITITSEPDLAVNVPGRTVVFSELAPLYAVHPGVNPERVEMYLRPYKANPSIKYEELECGDKTVYVVAGFLNTCVEVKWHKGQRDIGLMHFPVYAVDPVAALVLIHELIFGKPYTKIRRVIKR